MNYIATSELGKGATSIVWMSKHKLLKTPFAIKVLNEEFHSDKKSKSLFIDNARSIAKLSKHQNIIRIHNLVDSDEMTAVVMEPIDGKSIRNQIENHPNQEYKTILNWISQIGDALKTCHAQNFFQLNICPSNILIEKDGNIKIIPNSAAEILKNKLPAEKPLANRLCAEAIAFCSPESFLPNGMVGKTNDIYNLGLVVYFMVARKDPFELDVNSIARLQQQIYNDSLPLTGTGWDDFIQKACAKNPSDRFQSVQEFLINIPNEEKAKKTTVLPKANPILAEDNKPASFSKNKSETTAIDRNTSKSSTSIKKRKNVFVVLSIVAILAILSTVGVLFFQESHETEKPASTESKSIKYKCRNSDCAGMPLYDAPGGCDLCGRELVAFNGETISEPNANTNIPDQTESYQVMENEFDNQKKEPALVKKQLIENAAVDSLAAYSDQDDVNDRKRIRSNDKSLVKCSYARCNNKTSNTNLIYDHPYKPFCSERCRQKFLN